MSARMRFRDFYAQKYNDLKPGQWGIDGEHMVEIFERLIDTAAEYLTMLPQERRTTDRRADRAWVRRGSDRRKTFV